MINLQFNHRVADYINDQLPIEAKTTQKSSSHKMSALITSQLPIKPKKIQYNK